MNDPTPEQQANLDSIPTIAAELRELERDKARLDWLETAKPNVFPLCTWGGSEIAPDNFLEIQHDGTIWEINESRAVLLRDAIDQAMRAETAADAAQDR